MKITSRATLIAASLLTTLSLLILFAQPVFGANENLDLGTNDEGKVTTPLANPNDSYGLLGGLVETLITIIIFGAALTAFIFFVIGAIQWGTAGSGDGAAKGRLTMIYAAVGMVVVAMVYVFMVFFNNILPPNPDAIDSAISPGECEQVGGTWNGTSCQ